MSSENSTQDVADWINWYMEKEGGHVRVSEMKDAANLVGIYEEELELGRQRTMVEVVDEDRWWCSIPGCMMHDERTVAACLAKTFRQKRRLM